MLRDGVLSRPTKYLMLQEEALWRPTKYLLQLRKHYDGRQSTSAFCASIVANDRIPYATEWSTMTADRVHYTTAETLRRPTEYFRILRKHRDGRQNIQSVFYRLLVQLENLFFVLFSYIRDIRHIYLINLCTFYCWIRHYYEFEDKFPQNR